MASSEAAAEAITEAAEVSAARDGEQPLTAPTEISHEDSIQGFHSCQEFAFPEALEAVSEPKELVEIGTAAALAPAEVARAVEPVAAEGAAAEPAEASPESAVYGDYKWKTPDGACEALLRLREGGLWWHAAHHSSTQQMQPGAKDVELWEMAESVGSWSLVARSRVEGAVSPSSSGVMLFFESCRWTAAHPEAQLRLRPAPKDREETEELCASGSLVACFAVTECDQTGERQLELLVEPEPLSTVNGEQAPGAPSPEQWARAVQVAYHSCGVVKQYRHGVAFEDAEDSYDAGQQAEAAPEASPPSALLGLCWSTPWVGSPLDQS